ncbi:unnamed protein product, partial [Prorocentrum cordatum]
AGPLRQHGRRAHAAEMKRTLSAHAGDVARELRQAGCLAAVQQQLPSPYAVLGLGLGEQDAGAIRQGFLRAVRIYPPQTHPAEFVCVVEAYEMLRNPERRAALDGRLAEVRGEDRRKHQRGCGGITPAAAAAFLGARSGPACAV